MILSSPPNDATKGVYVDLSTLAALRFHALGFSFLPRQPITSLLAGRHASRLRGRGLNFQELRQYQLGDDIRQIDWKATLRTRKTQTRVYTEERERTVLLLIDQRLSMFFGSVKNMKSVTAAEAAALAAWRVLHQKDRIGALVFNDTAIDQVSPHRSQTTVMRILQAITEQNQSLSHDKNITPKPTQLNEALKRAEQLAKHDTLLCLITDADGTDAETRAILTRIAAHNDILVIFIVDPMEERLPETGPLTFRAGEHQLEVDTNNPQLQEAFVNAFATHRAQGKKFLLQREAPVLPLSTAQNVLDQFKHQLGRRAHR